MADTVWLVIVFLTVALAVTCVLAFHLQRQRKGQSEVILRLLNREYYQTNEPDERAASNRTQQLADHFSDGNGGSDRSDVRLRRRWQRTR